MNFLIGVDRDHDGVIDRKEALGMRKTLDFLVFPDGAQPANGVRFTAPLPSCNKCYGLLENLVIPWETMVPSSCQKKQAFQDP